MAIGVRDSEERVTGGLKLMTGANFVYVKAISPTVEEMKSVLGFDEPKAPTPSVDTDTEGNTRVRLDFWLSRPEDEFLYRESFFITKKDVTSQSGKVQFVNNFAQFCYADPNEGPQYEWFSKEGLRRAFNGEEAFINFVRAWVNHKGGKKGEQLFFDNWDAIFTGNFAEIKGILKMTNDGEPNRVGVLFGVKTTDEGKQYQTAYKKLYVRPYQNAATEFQKALNDEYGAFNHDYQGSLVWQDYNPTAVKDPVGSEAPGASDSPWG